MTGFGQQLVGWAPVAPHGEALRNQSGPLSTPDRRFGTVEDRQSRNARKPSTFGMSRRTVADAKRAVRLTFRSQGVSSARRNSSARVAVYLFEDPDCGRVRETVSVLELGGSER